MGPGCPFLNQIDQARRHFIFAGKCRGVFSCRPTRQYLSNLSFSQFGTAVLLAPRGTTFTIMNSLVAEPTQTMRSMLAGGHATFYAAIVEARPAILQIIVLLQMFFRLMAQGVFSSQQQLKVLNTVIRLVAIYVMNMLIGAQRSPQVLLHYQAMFIRIAILRHMDFHIPSHVNETPPIPVGVSFARTTTLATSMRTKSSFTVAHFIGLRKKGYAALFTCSQNWHSSLPYTKRTIKASQLYHGANPDDYDVLLGRVGAELLESRAA